VIDVSILGATGMVGQRFVELLANHPFFRIKALFASEKRRGERYGDSVQWVISAEVPENVRNIPLSALSDDVPTKIVFSALPSSVAGEIETQLAQKGHYVFSNASAHRYDRFVPIIVPEVNPEHFEAVHFQNTKGFIITNPNCSTAGIVIPLKAIQNAFGIESFVVFTMQALSGAGFPGVPSLGIYDNVIPFIENEEDKIKKETRKILGEFDREFALADFSVEARCNRVAVRDGHTEVLFIKTKNKPTLQEFKDSLRDFYATPQKLHLPTAPLPPIILKEDKYRPQPVLDRNSGKGMAVTVGNIRETDIFDFTFTVLSHNTIRGAAGGSVLNAELFFKEGKLNV
jgi:aspartate-semialdehyde dehydrogenase